MSNFWQRTLSGAVYAALVIASTLTHPIFFGLLFMIVTALAVREYHHLMQSHKSLTTCAIGSAVMLFALVFCIFAQMYNAPQCTFLQPAYPYLIPILIGGFVIFSLTAVLIELFRTPTEPLKNWGDLWTSLIMIALPFSLMNAILLYNKYILLALFIMIWVNDSGAYCIGSLLSKRKSGNHKMFPRVSPGKSWEGLIGGVIFSLLAGYIFYLVGWTDTMHLTCSPLIDSLLFAMVISTFGTLGDLIESLFKRTIGVKDSGKFMPGHGGVLDRFDSLLLATPVVYLIFVYLANLL